MTGQERLKTGTTLVVINCKDGVVLAADKRATAGFVVDKNAQKINIITPYLATAQAGLVSDAQLLTKLLRAEMQLKDLHTNRITNVKEAANLLSSMLYNNLRRPSMVPGIVAFLLAGYDDERGHQAYALGIDGSISEVDDYSSDGSGSVFALGVLEANYKQNLTTEEGVKLAIKAVNAAINRDTASGNGIDVVTVTKDGVKEAFKKQLETNIQ